MQISQSVDRRAVRDSGIELIATYRLPPMPENAARKVKASATKNSVLMRPSISMA